MLTLLQLNIGESAQVVGFEPENKAYRQQLMALGLTIGTRFEVVRRAPLGDPIALIVKGCCICLRKNEAKILMIEKCP